MNASNEPPTEPSPSEFFATSDGVCVYVNVRGQAFRVQFETLDGPATAWRTSDPSAAEAVAAASVARAKHRAELVPLFEVVKIERTTRRR